MRQKNRFLYKTFALLFGAMSMTTNIFAQEHFSYHPDGKDFVAVGGSNMFTKSLASSRSSYCIMTSDIPIFKISEQEERKVLSLTITSGDKTFALGKAAHCESRYSEGARRYILSDDSWGQGASVEIVVCPLTQGEGAIMKFESKGWAFDAQITATIEGQPSKSWFAQSESYLQVEGFAFADHTQNEMARTFTIAQRWNKAISERIEIATPDPYLNNVVGALLTASHGDWEKYKWIDGYDYDANAYEYLGDGNSKAAHETKLALAEYMNGSPNRAFSKLHSTIVGEMYQGESPAQMPVDATGEALRAIVQGLFGIQPEANGSRCIVRPGLPREWKEASIRTPYIIYKYHRVGGRDIYEITQNFAQPLDIIVRQNTGNGQYKDFAGTNKKHQIISVAALDHDIEDAPAIVEKEPQQADTIPVGKKCQEVKLGKKKPLASTAKGYRVGFDIKAKGKYSLAYLLISGKFNANKESGQAIATYSDGSQEILSIGNPPANNEGECLLKLPLNPSKKLKTISIVALADGVEIQLERLVLEL